MLNFFFIIVAAVVVLGLGGIVYVVCSIVLASHSCKTLRGRELESC